MGPGPMGPGPMSPWAHGPMRPWARQTGHSQMGRPYGPAKWAAKWAGQTGWPNRRAKWAEAKRAEAKWAGQMGQGQMGQGQMGRPNGPGPNGPAKQARANCAGPGWDFITKGNLLPKSVVGDMIG